MEIAIIAHDLKKELVTQFCIAYCGILSKHNLCATNITAKYISEATGLEIEKMLAGKAVIAVAENGDFAGFSYIETWGHKQFVANSGLIVAHAFRGQGLAMRIKRRIFQLSQELYPKAKIFSITTGAAVMKMNYELGFRPVPFSFLTDDPEFWKGCQGCRNYPILESNSFKMCLCTGLLYDPEEHIVIENQKTK